MSILPNLDAIDSFRVLTSNFDAEYGNSSGGQILVITKAGKAQMHGSAFEFLRNTSLDARNYFSRDRAAYRQNQFGGTLGGAPFRTKNLTLFADYQGTRLTEGIDATRFAARTGIALMDAIDRETLARAVEAGYLRPFDGSLRATPEGRKRLDALLGALVL